MIWMLVLLGCGEEVECPDGCVPDPGLADCANPSPPPLSGWPTDTATDSGEDTGMDTGDHSE